MSTKEKENVENFERMAKIEDLLEQVVELCPDTYQGNLVVLTIGELMRKLAAHTAREIVAGAEARAAQ